MTSTRVTYRARVLRVLNAYHGWMHSRDVAQACGLTYHQTIYALNALLNAGHIARQGKKATAQWGSTVLVEHSPAADALATLHALFHAAPNHPRTSSSHR